MQLKFLHRNFQIHFFPLFGSPFFNCICTIIRLSLSPWYSASLAAYSFGYLNASPEENCHPVSVFSWQAPPRHFKLSSKQRPFCSTADTSLHCGAQACQSQVSLKHPFFRETSPASPASSAKGYFAPFKCIISASLVVLHLSLFKNNLLSTVLFRSMLDYTGFDDSGETFYFLPACIYIAFYFLLHKIPESCYYTC